MNHSMTAFKTREQLHLFLGELSPHFSKPTAKFVGEMLYGIQKAQDVKLSEIARALDAPISMKKQEDRLSRMLANPDIENVLCNLIPRLGAHRVHTDTLILLDPSDIVKLYAEKMEFLARVRDGSTGEIENGYTFCLAAACESGERAFTPLNLRLWSTLAPEFTSQNTEILGMVEQIRAHTKKRGIYVMDRGGDGDWLFDALHGWGLEHIKVMKRQTSHGVETYELEYGVMNVALPQRPQEPLRLVVVRGFGEAPMMLLTTLARTDSRKSLWQVVEGYLTRWRVEDALRFIKQSYHLEDIRVMRYARLKNLLSLLLAVVYFGCVWLAGRLRCEILTGNITHAAKRIYGVSEFLYYAVADGIGRLLNRHGRWVDRRETAKQDDSNPLGLLFSG